MESLRDWIHNLTKECVLRHDFLNESGFAIGSRRHTYLGTEFKCVSFASLDLVPDSGCDSVPRDDSYAKSKSVQGFALGTELGQS